MPEGAIAYNHYRSGSGKDLKVDLDKAFKEDSYNKHFVQMIAKAQSAAENSRKANKLDEFSMTGDFFRFLNGSSENWQKVLGAFDAWGSADVSYSVGKYTMTYSIHVKDRYNFNRGILGWAKSFISYGEATRKVIWNEGDIEDASISCESGR